MAPPSGSPSFSTSALLGIMISCKVLSEKRRHIITNSFAEQLLGSVSECQEDGNWSPVSLRCIFDPAAVARNMQRGRTVLWEREEDMNMGTIIAIVVICALVIISGLIAFIVISNRRNGGVTRATKLSRLNGVKVLPDIVTKSSVLDCRVSFTISAITGYV